MSWPYAYTPAIWPSVLTVLLLIALSAYAWRRRSVPGALVFAIGCQFAALWVTGSGLEVAAVDLECKIFWLKFQGVWQLPVVTAVTCFIIEYAWPGRWLTRRNLAFLSIPSLLVLGLVLTDDLHHLIWRGFAYDGIMVIPLRGPVNWIGVAYGYGWSIVNLVVLAWLFLRSPQHRWPVVFILTGQIGAHVVYGLDVARAVQSNVPLDVPAIALWYLMYAIALFGFRIFDPIPLARQQVIAQMREGMLVLDPLGRVASLNPAAESILRTPAARARGKTLVELLPAFPDLSARLVEAGASPLDISLGTGPDARIYAPRLSLLQDYRGLLIGRLLTLRDVTEQRQAQAQLMEQQRALATLQERERLGRELHDDLAQVLGYVKMKAQIAREALAEEEKTAVDRHLAQLLAAAQEAHADVRDYLLGFGTDLPAGDGFLSSLRAYLRRFGENYEIETDLTVSPEITDRALEPVAQVQLLRIIQEALTNTRKHAAARRAHVSLSAENGLARIVIEDDGRSFDPRQAAEGTGQTYGLRIMRERAAEVGGSVKIDSAPGRGTRVVVEMPLKD